MYVYEFGFGSRCVWLSVTPLPLQEDGMELITTTYNDRAYKVIVTDKKFMPI